MTMTRYDRVSPFDSTHDNNNYDHDDEHDYPSFLKSCPTRAFIQQALHLQQDSHQNDNITQQQSLNFRITGVVVSDPIPVQVMKMSCDRIISSSMSTTTTNHTINSDPCDDTSKNCSQIIFKAPKNQCNHNCYGFLLDDGTSMIDVLFNYENSRINNHFSMQNSKTQGMSSSLPSYTQNVNDTNIDSVQNYNHNYSHFVNQPSKNTSSLCSISLGDTVECIGRIVTIHGINNHQSNNINHSLEHQDQATPIPCLLLSNLSTYDDPNMNSLRMAELSTACSDSLSLSLNDTESSNGSCVGGDVTGIYMYGTLVSRLSPFQFSQTIHSSTWMDKGDSNNIMPTQTNPPNNTKTIPNHHQQQHQQQQQQKSLSLEKSYIFHLIQYSKPEGISLQDLSLVLHCDDDDKYRALKDAVNDLQSNFEIYQSKDGTYLPI